MRRQVQHGSALRASQPRWNVHDLTAQGRAAGHGEPVCAQGAGGAEQVVGEGRADRPGTVGCEAAGRHMCQRSVDQVGEHGLDNRVAAMDQVGLDGRLGAVGQERVVPPDRELGCLGDLGQWALLK